jgi:hypothetical protein
LQASAFPTLDEVQIAELRRCTGASLERYPAGRALFEIGDRDFKFFVVKSGEVEVQGPSSESPKTILIHRPRQFTGDAAHLAGTPSVVRAIARTDASVGVFATEGADVRFEALRRVVGLAIRAAMAPRPSASASPPSLKDSLCIQASTCTPTIAQGSLACSPTVPADRSRCNALGPCPTAG